MATSIAEQLLQNSGNTTALQDIMTSGWQARPLFRGTSEILWSCSVTIFACVYTAIHIDIPSEHKSMWSLIARKLHWAFVALAGPERVLQAASRQWRAARQITKKLNEITPRCTRSQDFETVESSKVLKPGVSRRPKNYNISNGFWIIMGGFVIDTNDLHDHYKRVTLTAKGAELLAGMGLLPDISQNQIADRSKTNAIGKVFICLQASWMILQNISRYAAGYPLTLLEVHAMGHVVCALCIYALWWNKPLDVEEPTVIDASKFQDILALMLMTTIPRPGGEQAEIKTISFNQGVCNAMKQHPHIAYGLEAHSLVKMKTSSQDVSYLEQHRLPPIVDSWVYTLDGFVTQKGQSLTCGITSCGPAKLELNVKDIRRFELTALAIRSIMPTCNYEEQILDDLIDKYGQCISTAQATNWVIGQPREAWDLGSPSDYYWSVLDQLLDQSQAYIAYLLPILWGVLHLTMWNSQFPSHMEEILWKISGVGTMILIPGIMIFIGVLDWNSQKRMPHLGDWKTMNWWLTFIIVAMSFIADSFCRVYLVIASFTSLRRVPLGVWAVTPWLQSFPHV